jgi:hypothetical protein
MNRAHEVTVVGLREAIIRLQVDGQEYEIDLARHSRTLGKATPAQRAKYEISPAGYGIHWPDLDEDLSIDGLIGIRHESPFVRTAA